MRKSVEGVGSEVKRDGDNLRRREQEEEEEEEDAYAGLAM
jgi:hypothetical protein